jgi:hypothetical protein
LLLICQDIWERRQQMGSPTGLVVAASGKEAIPTSVMFLNGLQRGFVSKVTLPREEPGGKQ